MPVDSFAKRRAVAHVKRPGNGVFPGTTSTVLGRAAAAWNYVTAEPTPPVGGGGIREKFTLGTKESLSITGEPTIGGQFAW